MQRAFLRRSRTFLERIARAAPPHVLSNALGEESPTGTIAHVLGHVFFKKQPISASDRALLDALSRGSRLRDDLLLQAGGAFTADQFGAILGIRTRRGVSMGRIAGRFLGVRVAGNRYVYPKIQLTEAGLLPGLQDFLKAFTAQDRWTHLMILLTPTSLLNGRRPVDALKSGDISEAILVARAYGEHGA
jgi:hypothetical protein